MSQPYWGIYCPQHPGSWYRNQNGELYHYPSPEIAAAHIETIERDLAGLGPTHLWTIVEFGKQEYVKHKDLSWPSTSTSNTEWRTTVCPVRANP